VSVEVVVASQDLDHRSKICMFKTYKVFGAIPLRLRPEHVALSGIITCLPLPLPSIFNFNFDVSCELTKGTESSGSGAVYIQGAWVN
jgi:hypothetical protein